MKNKIKLRDWLEKDLELYRFWYTGDKAWKKFDGPYYQKPTPAEVEETINTLKLKIISNNWDTPRQRMVIATETDDQLIGTVSWYWQSQETNWKSIGIVIYDENYWSGGIGSQALQLWVNYLFENCSDIVRLDLRTWSGNERMMNLGKKLGFKEEARFRKARIVDGVYFDSIGMGLLREEWERRSF